MGHYKPEEERKTTFIGAWVPPATKRKFQAAAVVSGTSESELLRRVVESLSVTIPEQHNGGAKVVEATRAAAAH